MRGSGGKEVPVHSTIVIHCARSRQKWAASFSSCQPPARYAGKSSKGTGRRCVFGSVALMSPSRQNRSQDAHKERRLNRAEDNSSVPYECLANGLIKEVMRSGLDAPCISTVTKSRQEKRAHLEKKLLYRRQLMFYPAGNVENHHTWQRATFVGLAVNIAV